MKGFKFKLFIMFLSLCLSFVICSCSDNGENSQVNPIIPQPTTEEIAFNSLLSRVAELENLSDSYNQENSTLRCLIYIRSGKYNSNEWTTIGGEIDYDFSAYVVSNQIKDISGLKNLDNFIIPSTLEKVDFVHMFATINVV